MRSHPCSGSREAARPPGTDAYVITKYADISRIIRDPETFPPSQLRQASDEAAEIFRDTGYGTPADARESLRPDLESHKQHRLQLTDPWVGPVGADQHADMIRPRSTRCLRAGSTGPGQSW